MRFTGNKAMSGKIEFTLTRTRKQEAVQKRQ